MALTYRALKHILKDGNTQILVNEREWGERRLSGAELEEFRRDFALVDIQESNLIETGEWVVEDLPETFAINGVTYKVPVGVEITMPNLNGPDKPLFHDVYYKWGPKMQEDPNLIYNQAYWV